jgi:hypothetical protein
MGSMEWARNMTKIQSLIVTLGFIGCTGGAVAVLANPAPALWAQHSGVAVASIRNIESISDWQTLDAQHLTLRINHTKQYLLTLKRQCPQLRAARLVGVSMSNQEIWAGFDHVNADGWQCPIGQIRRMN